MMINKDDDDDDFKPKGWNMKVQVYQKALNQLTWKFNTMLRMEIVFPDAKWWRHNKSNIADGRPPYWN